MSSVLFALIFIGVAVVVTVIAWWLAAQSRPSKSDPETYGVLVALHGIRRRFDLFMFKAEVTRNAQHAERQIKKELNELRRREHGR